MVQCACELAVLYLWFSLAGGNTDDDEAAEDGCNAAPTSATTVATVMETKACVCDMQAV